MSTKSAPLPKYRVRVPPDVLSWARETAAMSIDDVARLTKVKAERIASWEAGSDEFEPPTISQLRLLAEKYRRPVSVFLRATPPSEQLSATYARRLHHAESDSGSRFLRFAVREACEQRALAISLMQQLGEESPEPEAVPADLNDAEASGVAIREALNVTDGEIERWASNGDTFLNWIDHIDTAGVLVTQFRYVEVSERRGFSIVETPLPLIAVNQNDARTARVFTLLHEYAHILAALADFKPSEPWCNAAAAAALMPATPFRAAHEKLTGDWQEKGMELATRFGVSREAAYRRLTSLGFITQDDYERARKWLLSEPKGNGGGFAPYPSGEVRRLGREFIKIVGAAYASEAISLYEASKYLGVKTTYVDDLINRATAA